MSGFFYQIVKDAINYDNNEQMAEMFALTEDAMRDWCWDQMNQMSIPYDFAKYVMDDLFADDSEFPYKFWRYIQDSCQPDPAEDEE